MFFVFFNWLGFLPFLYYFHVILIQFPILFFFRPNRDKYRFYACLLRARFDENKDLKDMVKATMLLKAGEEEFWTKQHPQPYIFPDSPGGTSYERYNCYKVRATQLFFSLALVQIFAWNCFVKESLKTCRVAAGSWGGVRLLAPLWEGHVPRLFFQEGTVEAAQIAELG